MKVNNEIGEALLRLHARANGWLKKSSIKEEASWREQANLLESKAVLESDDEKRAQIEHNLREQKKFLDNLNNRLTHGYANLIFAYGLARVGFHAESASLEAATAPMFKTDDPVHQRLFRAFTYRINLARNGEPNLGPLPEEIVVTFPSEKEQGELEDRLARYKYDRLRSCVRILEPTEEIDPYRRWHGRFRIDDATSSLHEITDPKKLERETRKLLNNQKDEDSRLKILNAALDLFPKMPSSYSRTVLEVTREFLEGLPAVGNLRLRAGKRRELSEKLSTLDPDSKEHLECNHVFCKEFRDLDRVRDRVWLMARAAQRAGDGADAALLRCVIRGLLQMIEAQSGEDVFNVLPVLAGDCRQSLQRLRSRGELEQLLERVTLLIQNQPLNAGQSDDAKNKQIMRLKVLMDVAAGWLYLGRPDRAAPSMDVTRNELFAPIPNPHTYTELACRYIGNLAHSSTDSALRGFDELFPGIGPLCDSFTTNSHFSLVRLQIIDAVVRGVVNLVNPSDDADDFRSSRIEIS